VSKIFPAIFVQRRVLEKSDNSDAVIVIEKIALYVVAGVGVSILRYDRVM